MVHPSVNVRIQLLGKPAVLEAARKRRRAVAEDAGPERRAFPPPRAAAVAVLEVETDRRPKTGAGNQALKNPRGGSPQALPIKWVR